MLEDRLQEISRLQGMTLFEELFRDRGFFRIAGIDEAGRGPLAGPVVAAACIVPKDVWILGVDDSKKLTAKERERLFVEIVEKTEYGIGEASVAEIDRYNILRATFLAMRRAVFSLKAPPDALLIDGNQVPRFEFPLKAIVQGDGKSVSIAAASILAKVTRDRMMCVFDREWPEYGFKRHKGYATEEHLKAIHAIGPSPIHRKSFDPVKSRLSLMQKTFAF